TLEAVGHHEGGASMTESPGGPSRFSYSLLGPDSFHAPEGAGHANEAFNEYRDLMLAAATNGQAAARVFRARGDMDTETGWHYHECEMQLFYIIAGETVIDVEGHGVIRFGPGSFFRTPGGVKHNAISHSSDLEGLEITFPAEITTIKC